MKYPPDTAWFRSIHYGVRHVCLWWAIYPDGRIHVASELVRPKCLISVFAKEIVTQTRRLGITAVRYTVGDKEQMLGTSKGVDGETRQDTFRMNGIVIRENTHDLAQGWTRVAELFGFRPDGRPWLTLDTSCEHVKAAIINAVSDPTDPDLVLESANTEPLSALRIGAMSRPSPRPFALPPLPKNAVGHLLEECRSPRRTGVLAWK